MGKTLDSWPIPFQQFVLKVHSRCNLSCDYCYVFNMGDHTWRSQPQMMAAGTVLRVAHRIAEHARKHRLPKTRIIFHGGEPLLAGTEFFDDAAGTLRAIMPRETEVDLSVQTNGTLLDEAFLHVLLKHWIRVGVSIDGGPAAHDRHRRYANGRGSHADVVDGIRLLLRDPYRSLFAGLLCTIDLDNDPIETYETLLPFAPPLVDFLLPHGNWTVRPPGRPDDASTPYADWLIQVFDRWYGSAHQETSVRFFQEIMHLLLGGRSRSEVIGLAPSNVITINTDGSIEQLDTLKSVYHGAATTGLNVFEHSFDVALEHPSFVTRHIGIAGLSEICQGCPVLGICGAGSYPHRYRADSGFRNPSVYCLDLQQLIEHIYWRVRADLPRILAKTH